ncbi:hypothetical protein VF06_37775, partial [Nostoc linckia z4]|uniref:hypothetical protein n=1 Tax=Nostoc linckia TaxID=92942 RepID=UPI000C02C646
TFISLITRIRTIWGSEEMADRAFYIGLSIYELLVAGALFFPTTAKMDKLSIRLFLAGAVNFISDWLFFNPYEFGANEYVFFVLVLFNEIRLYRKEKKAEADKLAGRYK